MSDDAFTLDTTRLFRAMRAPGRDEARYYLRGALIEPIPSGGAWIVATDGLVLLIQRDRAAVAPKAMVLRIIAPEFQPAEPDGFFGEEDTPQDGWDWSGTTVTIPLAVETAVQACVVRLSNGYPAEHVLVEHIAEARAFPDWRKVIGWTEPKPVGSVSVDRQVGVNLQLLAMMARDDTGLPPGVRIRQAGPGHPYHITTDDPDTLGIVMPRGVPTDEPARYAAILADIAATAPTGVAPTAPEASHA